MEEIEYLEEYEDLVLPALNSAAAAAALSTSTNQIPAITNTKSIAHDDDDASSSSLDQDIFNCLFEDNSDDEKSEDNVTSLTHKADSRTSVDSLDLLVHDLDEQVAKEIALKNAQQEQKNKINTSLKAATKIPSSTPKPKTFMSKNSGTTITINKNTTATTATPTTQTNKKFIATVRPTVQNQPQQQQQPKKNTNIIQRSSFTQQPQKSTSFTGIITEAAASPTSSIKPTTSRTIQLPVLARKPLASALSSTTSSATTTLGGQKFTSNPAIKPTVVQQVIKRPATIVKPEKVITKDPIEDPLNLDDISEAASDNYSVSDISGDTYNSVSNFDDDDDDDDEDDYYNEEQLNEDDDFSSNSQIIEISLDSSGSHSNLEVLRASTPSPIMSRDKPSSSSGFDKWKYQSTKLFANHNIVRGLLTRGEKPKLLDLIRKYDTHRDSSDEEDNEVIDITNSRENLGPTKSHVNTKETHKNVTSFKNPTPSNKDNCKTNKVNVTAKTKTHRRETKSPGGTSNDSYLSAVEELLEESYAEAMKKIKQSGGTSLHNQEVGAEMEIGQEDVVVGVQEPEQTQKPKNTKTGIVIEYEDNLLENTEEELKEKKTEELENKPEEIKETELNKPEDIKETLNELNKTEGIEDTSNEIKDNLNELNKTDENKEISTEFKKKETEEIKENIKEINKTAEMEEINELINKPTEITETSIEIKANTTETTKMETMEKTQETKESTDVKKSNENIIDKTLEEKTNDLETVLTEHEKQNITELLNNLNTPVNQSPSQRKKKRFRNLISPEPSKSGEVSSTEINKETQEDVGDFKGFEDEATHMEIKVTNTKTATETIEKQEKSSDKDTAKVIFSTSGSFKSPSSSNKTSLDKHKDTKSSRDSSLDKSSRDIKEKSSKDGHGKDKSSRESSKDRTERESSKDKSSKDGHGKDKSSRESSKDRTERESSKDRTNRSLNETKTSHDQHASHSKHSKGSRDNTSKHHSHHKDHSHRKSIDSKESSRSRESSKSRDPKESKMKIEITKPESKTTEAVKEKTDSKKPDLNTSKHKKSPTKDLKATATDKELPNKKLTVESKDKTDLNKTKDLIKDKKTETKDQGIKTTTTNEAKQMKDKKDASNTRDISKERKDLSKSKDSAENPKLTKDSKDAQKSVNETPNARESTKDHKDHKKQPKDLTNLKKPQQNIQTNSSPTKKIDNKESANKPSTSKNKAGVANLNNNVIQAKDLKKPENPKDLLKGAAGTPQKVLHKSKESKDIKVGDIKNAKDKPTMTTKQNTQSLTKTTISTTKETKPAMVTKIHDKKITSPTKDNRDKNKLQEPLKSDKIKDNNNTTTVKADTTKIVKPKESLTGNNKQTKHQETVNKEIRMEKVNVSKNITLQKDTTKETAATTPKSDKTPAEKKSVPIKLKKPGDLKPKETPKTLDTKTTREVNNDETEKSIKPDLIKTSKNDNLKLDTTKTKEASVNTKELSQDKPKTCIITESKDDSKSITPKENPESIKTEIIQECKIEKKKIKLKRGHIKTAEAKSQEIKTDKNTQEIKTEESVKQKSMVEAKDKMEEKKPQLSETKKQEEIQSHESIEKEPDLMIEVKTIKVIATKEEEKEKDSKVTEIEEGSLENETLLNKTTKCLVDEIEKVTLEGSDEMEENKPEPRRTRNRDNQKAQEHKSQEETTTKLVENKAEAEEANLKETTEQTKTSEDLITKEPLSHETKETNVPTTKSEEFDKTLEALKENNNDEITEEVQPEPRRTRNRDNLKAQEHKSKETENKEEETTNAKTSSGHLLSEDLTTKESSPLMANETDEIKEATHLEEAEKTSDETEEDIKPEPRRTRQRDNLKSKGVTENKEDETLNETKNTKTTSEDLISKDLLTTETPTTTLNETDEINEATQLEESEKTSDETEEDTKPEPRRTRKRDQQKALEHKSKELSTEQSGNKEEKSLKETVNPQISSEDLICKDKPAATHETISDITKDNPKEINTYLVITTSKEEEIKADEKEKEPKQIEPTETTSSLEQLNTSAIEGETTKTSNIITTEVEEAAKNPEISTPNKEPEIQAENSEVTNLDKLPETSCENIENPLINIQDMDNTCDKTLENNNTLASDISASSTDITFRRTLRKRGTDSPLPENDNTRKILKDPLAKTAMGTPKSVKSDTPVTDVLSPAAKRNLRLPPTEAEIQNLAKKPKLDGAARKSARFRNFNDDCLEEEELPMVNADDSTIEMSPQHTEEAASPSPRKSIRRTDTLQTKTVEPIKEPPKKIQRVEITETDNTAVVVTKETTLNPNNNKSMEIQQPPRKILRREVLDFGAIETTNETSTADTIITTKLNISGRKISKPEDVKTPKVIQKSVSSHKTKTVSSSIEKERNPESPDKSKTSKVTTAHTKSPGFSAVLSFTDWLKNKNQSKNTAQQQTTGLHVGLKDEQTRRIRVRETKTSSTAKDMKAPPITNEKESQEVSNIRQQELNLPAENAATELNNESTQEIADNTISDTGNTSTLTDKLNTTSTTEHEQEQELNVTNEDEHGLLEHDNSLLQPAENQLQASHKKSKRRPLFGVRRRTVKRLDRSDRKVRKKPVETQQLTQESPKPIIIDYEGADKIKNNSLPTTTLLTPASEMPAKREKIIQTPKPKIKKSEIDVLIESMSKEMKEGGIQDLLNVDKHVKRQRLASKRRTINTSSEHLNASANESLTSSVEANLTSDISLLRGTPSAMTVADIVETTLSDNIAKSPTKRHNVVAKSRKSLPAKEALRRDIYSALSDSAPTADVLASDSPLRDATQNNNEVATTKILRKSNKSLRKSLKNNEMDMPKELQASESTTLPQIPTTVDPLLLKQTATKRRKSLATNEIMTKETTNVAGEMLTNTIMQEPNSASSSIIVGNVTTKSRKSIKHTISETQQQQQQLPLNKNNRYINKVNTNVFKTPKPITHSTILNRIPAIDDITQLYAIKRPQISQKSKQPSTTMLPSVKCRKVRVRLNRSLVKRYWKSLKQKQLVSSVITTLTEATEKAAAAASTVDIVQNNSTTNLRIHSVVSTAGLLSSPTLISSEELLETPAVTTQQLEPALTIPAAIPTTIANHAYLPPTTSVNNISSLVPLATPLDTGVPVELKNEFMDENPIGLENTVLPDTPTLLARAQSVTQAAQHALSSSVIPTDIRLLTTEAASNTHVPSFGVTPTQLDNRGTCMYTFLHPAKYNRNHSNVLLDYCCPNLDGPMPAIDPTRIHAQVQTRVIELPACIVLTTKVVTRADLESNKSLVPAIIRKKAERIRSNIAAHHNVATAAPPSQPIQPVPQQLTVAPPILPAVPPQQLSSTINALARHLPPTTTITPKLRPTQPQSAVAHPMPTVSVVPKGLPQHGNMLKNYVQPLRSNLRRFDVLLKQLVKPFDSLTFVDRHRIIESIITSGKLSPRDLERTLVLMEEYLTHISLLQTQQTANINASSYSSTQDEAITNLPMQMPQLQPAPKVMAASTSSSSSSSSTFATATKQLEKLKNKTDRKIQTTKKNTSLTTARRAAGGAGGGGGEVKQHHVPIYDTDRNIIGYQLQMVTPLSTMPAYTKSTMSSLTSSGIMSTSLENQITSYSIRKRPAQESPRVFYTTPPLQTSTPKAPNYTHMYTTSPQNSKAVAQKSQKGSVVTVRSGSSTPSGSSETITTTTMATVKRVTRSTATGSKIIIVSKSNQSSEETILPDGNNQQAAEIKNENDIEDFIG